MPETAEELSEKPEVRQELARAGNTQAVEKVKAETKEKFWFVTHGLLLLGCAILYFLIGSKFIPILQAQVDLTRRLLRGAAHHRHPWHRESRARFTALPESRTRSPVSLSSASSTSSSDS